jgi:hypothetical protein
MHGNSFDSSWYRRCYSSEMILVLMGCQFLELMIKTQLNDGLQNSNFTDDIVRNQ